MALQKIMKCSPCAYEGTVSKSTNFCVDCNEFLCSSCLKHHQKFSMLLPHTVIDKDELNLSGNISTTKKSATLPSQRSQNAYTSWKCGSVENETRAITLKSDLNVGDEKDLFTEDCTFSDSEDKNDYVQMRSPRNSTVCGTSTVISSPPVKCSGNTPQAHNYVNFINNLHIATPVNKDQPPSQRNVLKSKPNKINLPMTPTEEQFNFKVTNSHYKSLPKGLDIADNTLDDGYEKPIQKADLLNNRLQQVEASKQSSKAHMKESTTPIPGLDLLISHIYAL